MLLNLLDQPILDKKRLHEVVFQGIVIPHLKEFVSDLIPEEIVILIRKMDKIMLNSPDIE